MLHTPLAFAVHSNSIGMQCQQPDGFGQQARRVNEPLEYGLVCSKPAGALEEKRHLVA